jgi:quinohemoprotein amine dehydrogenase
MTKSFRSAALGSLICTLLAAPASGQSPGTEREAGVPVTDPLVIAKCGSCHPSDDRGNMQRLSWERTTPEGWQDVLKEMILLDRVSVTPAEARSIVKYLAASHGLAPDEAKPVMYDAERRVHEETLIPSESLREACSKCHAFARPLSWRRSAEDWKQFAVTHGERYKIKSTAEAVTFLAGAAPLHTSAWDTWSSRQAAQNLAGRWLVCASMPGRGAYFGEMQVDKDGEDDYTTRVTLTSVRDASRISRSGRVTVFGGSAWRGRSKGSATTAGSTPDDPSAEAREVLLIATDRATAEGRWFWGQYQEFGFDVKLQRASSDPTLIGTDRSSLKTGSKGNRVRLIGDNFPPQVAASDLDFGPGVTVRVASHSPSEIVAELDVAADARLGKRDVAFHQSSLPGAIAIYDRIDYIAVTPDSTMAAFADRTHPKGYQQFEAIGYQRGPDGKLHTADDVALGPVDVIWTHQVFHAGEHGSSDAIGAMSPLGLFTPASANPGANFDVFVIATARDEKDQKGEPLVGKSYLVVTVPTYVFNGRQYVRELDRWVDDGPARK